MDLVQKGTILRLRQILSELYGRHLIIHKPVSLR
jgi:hypothetical protein